MLKKKVLCASLESLSEYRNVKDFDFGQNFFFNFEKFYKFSFGHGTTLGLVKFFKVEKILKKKVLCASLESLSEYRNV